MPALMRRAGATLLEIVAVLGILGIIASVVGDTIVRQQRLYRSTSELIDTRRSVRDALDILAGEIRGASIPDTIRLMADSAVELFTTIGTSVACTTLSSTDLGLAPPALTGVGATSWITQPDTGDFAVIYRADPGAPGAWERYRIRSIGTRATASACPVMSGASSGFDASASSYALSLTTSPPTIRAGSPVRFVRRGRYSLYKSSDGKWYLGYRRCNALGSSVCGAIQPLSGYYKPYSSDTTRTGLLFRYFDSSDRPLAPSSDPLTLARVQILARALSQVAVTLNGAGRQSADSGSLTAAIRNE